MRKKFLALLGLLLAIAMVAAACGNDDDGDDASTDATEEPTEAPGGDEGTAEATGEEEGTAEAASGEAVGGEVPDVGLVYDIGGRGDQSFNDLAYAGLEQAQEELGADYQDLEPDEGGENRAELLQLLADEGRDLIVGNGFLFADSIGETAANNPDTQFAVVDTVVEAPNVTSLTFAEEQGSFLVGVAAALKTETGTVGFIGGVETELIQKFEAGYVAGVEAIDPDIEVLVDYITQPPDFDGFNAPERGREIANNQYSQGADIVYAAAGGSGAGVFEAAAETTAESGSKVWVIGVDSDQYNIVGEELQEYILTSMLKNVDVAIFGVISEYADGTLVPGVEVYDLSIDGVGYSTSGGFVDDIADQLEEYKAQIIDGEIEVPTTP